jgi:myo-inositol-1(or 4)-monophosphatase
VNLESISRQAAQLSREVGQFLLKEGAGFDVARLEYKGVNNLVSYVDKEAEKALVKGLRDILPEAGFITEEGTVTEKSEIYNWVIDPLDGTTNFVHQVPLFCISVGLIEGRVPIAGVVHEPHRNECFTAWKGGGAYCNDQPIRVSAVQKLEDSLLATGFPYAEGDKMEIYLSILKELLRRSHGLRRLGSAAIDLAWVACGRFQAFYEYNLNPWDVAAGVLLVQEAGGIVTDFKGGDNFVFGGQLVASGHIQQELLDVIGMHWKV